MFYVSSSGNSSLGNVIAVVNAHVSANTEHVAYYIYKLTNEEIHACKNTAILFFSLLLFVMVK